MHKIIIYLLLWNCFGSDSFAVGLTPPFGFDSAATLPKGIRNVRMLGMTTEGKTFFDENNNAQPLGHTMHRNITYGEMIEALPDANQRADYRGILQARGMNLNETAGESLGIVTARVTVAIPVLAYGITDNWTSAIAVPIVRSSFIADTGFKASPSLNRLSSELYAEGFREEMNSVGGMTQDVIRYMNDSGGYGPFRNETRTELGDINLVNKFRFLKTDDWALAAIGTVILPTGRQSDWNRMVDIGSGDKAWSLGAGLVADYTISAQWSTTTSVSYLAQLPDTYPRRLPKNYDFNMSPEYDANISRDRGDIMRGASGVKFRPFEDWNTSAAYSLGYKEQDKLSGDIYPAYRYNYLEFNTEQWMHSATFGVGYSTLNKFRRQAAAIPFEVNLNYAHIISGRNAPRDDMIAFETVVYF